MARSCPNCSRAISGHPNKRFCNSTCKDRYHNLQDPSRLARVGIYIRDMDEEAHEAGVFADEAGWDGHKGYF